MRVKSRKGSSPFLGTTFTLPVSGRLAQLVEHLVYTEGVGGSSPSSPTIIRLVAQAKLAQLVERMSEKHEVTGSSPVLGTNQTASHALAVLRMGRSHSGLVRGTGNAVGCKPSRVQISLSPPTEHPCTISAGVLAHGERLVLIYRRQHMF